MRFYSQKLFILSQLMIRSISVIAHNKGCPINIVAMFVFVLILNSENNFYHDIFQALDCDKKLEENFF